MAGVSSESLATGLAELEAKLPTASLQLAKELFGILGMVDSSAGLRRALTDPSRNGDEKSALVRQLVGGKVSADAAEIAGGLAGSRWATARDIGDALETLAATVVISLAEKMVPGVSEEAKVLITQAVTQPRGIKPTRLVERFAELAAKRQQRWIATVSVTRPLTQTQLARLQAGLNAMYGRDLKVNINVDPALIGGIRVQIGDEVLDASVLTRLGQLQRQLAG